MHLSSPKILAAISGFLALCAANPVAVDAAPATFEKRACPADCNNQYPLARKLGAPCGGGCDTTYRDGAGVGRLRPIAGRLVSSVSTTSPATRQVEGLASLNDGKLTLQREKIG
ncbi:MAG: hypothetical protein Q9212_002982 [Teloschistes hypoglaucus]